MNLLVNSKNFDFDSSTTTLFSNKFLRFWQLGVNNHEEKQFMSMDQRFFREDKIR